jgi:hypothetical protein
MSADGVGVVEELSEQELSPNDSPIANMMKTEEKSDFMS